MFIFLVSFLLFLLSLSFFVHVFTSSPVAAKGLLITDVGAIFLLDSVTGYGCGFRV